jgi:hypothetical protein
MLWRLLHRNMSSDWGGAGSGVGFEVAPVVVEVDGLQPARRRRVPLVLVALAGDQRRKKEWKGRG